MWVDHHPASAAEHRLHSVNIVDSCICAFSAPRQLVKSAEVRIRHRKEREEEKAGTAVR